MEANSQAPPRKPPALPPEIIRPNRKPWENTKQLVVGEEEFIHAFGELVAAPESKRVIQSLVVPAAT
jgi:hypothetical protein